jgi:hypothetical protein
MTDKLWLIADLAEMVDATLPMRRHNETKNSKLPMRSSPPRTPFPPDRLRSLREVRRFGAEVLARNLASLKQGRRSSRRY